MTTAVKTAKRVVVHHGVSRHGETACGVDYYSWSIKDKKQKIRKGWGGVNCQRCLKVKAKRAGIKAAKKAGKPLIRKAVEFV